MQETHKPGPLKQQNKKHKHGRHRSNHELSAATRGKSVKTITRGKTNRDLTKIERRNQVNQLRQRKRDQVLSLKRSLGKEAVPPILIAVYATQGIASLSSLLSLIRKCDADAVESMDTKSNSLLIYLPKFKTRYNFICVPDDTLFALMDAVKIADLLLLVHSLTLESEQDILNDAALASIYSHFLPTTIHVLPGLNTLPVKKRGETKSKVAKALQSRFPDDKLVTVDTSQEALQLMHVIGNVKRKTMNYKSKRTQVLAQEVSFVSATSLDNNKAANGTLFVSGYVRSRDLDVNSLLHIPGWGDFQMESIEVLPDPFSTRNKKHGDAEMSETRILKPDPMIQESLDRENEVDDMEGEQTFPTAEEIAVSIAEQAAKKKKRKVPKGTSDYQAAWIEDDEEDDDDDLEGSDEEEDMEEPEQEEEEEEDNDGSGEDTMADNVTVKFDEEMEEVNEDDEDEYKKFKKAREDEEFPDEVDTPMDVAARVRFARYRGLKSFNYSSWDPKENLPSDYSRIFQFENFNRTKRRVLKMESNEETSAVVGSFVKIAIRNVPEALKQVLDDQPGRPLVIFGLLKHENKLSVLNMLLRKHPSFETAVKSKEKLIFHVGCRRFFSRPIFSAHTNGNKFKYERFLRDDCATVASVYAPITYPPSSVVVFKLNPDGSQSLVATGSILSVNPNRIVAKRIILSGHPFKINKKAAIVRYMFFNRDDILWFKPVELRTKYGRRGHIKEPLGTHGHMKCYFDRQITSMDTVLMSLYKRVFPKWVIDDRVPDPIYSQDPHDYEIE